MRLPWPRSLFARMMLIWLVGIAVVLAVSFMLFVGERERVGRAALFEGIAQEIAAAADVLDKLPADERVRWIDELGRRRLRLSLRPPGDHLRRLPQDHALRGALRQTMPERAIVLCAHAREGRRHPVPVASLRLTDGSPLQVTTNVLAAFIQGREIDLRNKQTALRDKYREKYRQLGIIEGESEGGR